MGQFFVGSVASMVLVALFKKTDRNSTPVQNPTMLLSGQGSRGRPYMIGIAVGTLIAERPPQSGRIEARTGLRMMPTFPRSPRSFRTAGFPQYGWKAGLSGGAFPDIRGLSLLPACAC